MLDQARAAAEVHASLAAQRSSSGTGEMLRSNFVVVADLVEEQDGHLLSSSEIARTAEFKVSELCAEVPAIRSAAVPHFSPRGCARILPNSSVSSTRSIAI